MTTPEPEQSANCNRESGCVQRMDIPREQEPTVARTKDAVRSGVGGLRAFEVTVKHWVPEHSGIYAATSAAKAKYASWRAAHDAGFDAMKFDDLRVKRAPEFDCIANQIKHGVDRTWAHLLKQKGGGGAEPGANNGTCETKNGAQGYIGALNGQGDVS